MAYWVVGLIERKRLYKKPDRATTAGRRAAEAFIFVVIFMLSVLLIAAIALAAPILLALAAMVGLLANKKNDKSWRAAGA